MNNIASLVKINLLSSFRINKLTQKKKRTVAGVAAIVLFIYLLILAFATLYMVLFSWMFNDAGKPDFILLMGIVITSLITLFTTIPKANAYIFRTKDYDLLMSLPIKNSDIVISKILSLYLYNLIFSFTMMVSMIIAYFIFAKFSISILLLYLLAIFIVPLFPMAIGSGIAFLVGYIPLKQKTKNLVTTLLYLVFFIPFFIIYMNSMNTSDEEFLNQIVKLYDVFGKLYFLGNMAFVGIMDGKILYYLLFILASLASIGVFIVIVASNFKSFNNLTNRVEVNKKFDLKAEKYTRSKSDIRVLFKKEISNYFNIPMYVMNTIVGPILSVIGTVILCVKMDEVISSLPQDGSFDPASLPALGMLLITGIMIFCISITSTTSSSISLEGKNYWILKSAPLKTKDIFISKILVNVLITVPFIFVNVVVAMIFTKANIVYGLLAFFIPTIYALTFSVIGLYFNILVPKFDFDNPIKVVKQGMPVLFTMLFAFLACTITIVTFIILSSFLDLIITLLIELVFAIIFFSLSIVLLSSHGVTRFERLDA